MSMFTNNEELYVKWGVRIIVATFIVALLVIRIWMYSAEYGQ